MNTFKNTILTIAWSLLATFVAASAQAASLPDFTSLVEKQGPAVVNISSTQKSSAHAAMGFPEFDESDPMFEFFRRFMPHMPDMPQFGSESQSLGSGFIISKDGYILTNAHVVADAEEIIVRLVDKREFHAQVIGADKRSDIALIKIDAADLPVVVMGDPEALKVGEWVVAIGSPFGFDHSVTAGIVSAKGRNLPEENFVPFIQTDVAINPGNSGGPLFNMDGRVIGINSQIYSQTGGFMGLSFAIPIDVAMDVQQQLRTDGRVRRGRIGVAIQEVTKALAESFGLPGTGGALVSTVEADGPAARAGVAQGDVILSFDGKKVESANDLPRLVSATRPDSAVGMRLFRNGKEQKVTITVGEWKDDATAVKVGRGGSRPNAEPNKLGLVVRTPSAAQLSERGAAAGLLIERVSGIAARAGLQSGDMLVSAVINGRQTELISPQVFEQLVEGLKTNQTITLLVQRRSGAAFYVSLKVGE